MKTKSVKLVHTFLVNGIMCVSFSRTNTETGSEIYGMTKSSAERLWNAMADQQDNHGAHLRATSCGGYLAYINFYDPHSRRKLAK